MVPKESLDQMVKAVEGRRIAAPTICNEREPKWSGRQSTGDRARSATIMNAKGT